MPPILSTKNPYLKLNLQESAAFAFFETDDNYVNKMSIPTCAPLC